MKINLIFCLLLTVSSARAGFDMSRYEVIIERQPFGKEPLTEEPAAPVKPVGEFAKQYRLCMLYQNTDGQLKAGLVSKTNNKNTFLQVGESDNGLSLVDVRLEEGIAVLQQGGETALLMLEGLGTPLAAPASSAPSAVAAVPAEPAQLIRRSGTDAAPAHVLAALTDSSPKKPRITVRKKETVPGAGTTASATGSLDESGSAGSGRLAPSSSIGETKTVAMATQSRAPANYLIQSVPARYNPF